MRLGGSIAEGFELGDFHHPVGRCVDFVLKRAMLAHHGPGFVLKSSAPLGDGTEEKGQRERQWDDRGAERRSLEIRGLPGLRHSAFVWRSGAAGVRAFRGVRGRRCARDSA
jgi:hypothetical protein